MASHANSLHTKSVKLTTAVVGNVAGKHKPAAKVGKGKLIDWSDAKVVKSLQDIFDAHVTPQLLAQLDLTRHQFEQTMEELRRRSSGGRQTIEQLVGTFFEIIGSQHADVVNMRAPLIDANFESALMAAFSGREVFMNAAGDVKVASSMPQLLDHIYWKDGGSFARKLLADFNTKQTPTAKRMLNDADLQALRDAVQPASLEEIRDLYIDGKKYCDRAVKLTLTNGKSLLLLSEEYKAPQSGGIRAQQAIRNNRLFNGTVKANSEFKYFDGKGNSQTMDLENLLLNCDTVANDQLGVKAAARTSDVEALVVKVTKSVRERKLKYGESLQRNRDANTIFFYIKLNYPSGLVRNVLTRVHGAMAK